MPVTFKGQKAAAAAGEMGHMLWKSVGHLSLYCRTDSPVLKEASTPRLHSYQDVVECYYEGAKAGKDD